MGYSSKTPKGPDISDDELNSVVLGQTVSVVNHVVQIQAGDSDVKVSSVLALPQGFELVGAPQPVIHYSDEAQIYVTKVTQPGYIGIFSNQKIDVAGTFTSMIEAEDDKKKQSSLSMLMLGLTNARAIDMSTHATIHYSFHIEGHKYGGDGNLSASFAYKLRRMTTPADYTAVFAGIAQALLTDDNDEFKAAMELLKEVVKNGK